MFGLRLPELLILLAVLVLLFGAKKLPQLGDSIGKSLRAFKKAADQGFDKDDAGPAETKSQEQLPHGAATAKAAPSPEAEKAKRSDSGAA